MKPSPLRAAVPLAIVVVAAYAYACGGGDDALIADGPDASEAGGGDDARAGSDASGGDDGSGGGGDAGSGDDARSDGPAAPKRAFLYTTSGLGAYGTNAVYGYKWDSTTGALSIVDMDPATAGTQPASAGTDPISVAAEPDGKHLWAANLSDHSVSAFSVDGATGVLTRVAANAADGGRDLVLGEVTYLAADPKGRCLYAVSQQLPNALYALAIDTATGALTVARQVPTAPNAQWIAVDAQARFLLVEGTNQELVMHPLEAATGLPVAGDGGTYATPPSSFGVALAPNGGTAYVTSLLAQRVLAFHVDTSTLALTPLPTADASVSPFAVAVHPSAPYVYAAGNGNGVSSFAIDGTGAATESAHVNETGFGQPIAMDPQGRFLYVGGVPGNGSVAVFTVNGATLAPGPTTDNADAAAYVPQRTFAWVFPP